MASERRNQDGLGFWMLMKLIPALGGPSPLSILLWKLCWKGTRTLRAKASLLPCVYSVYDTKVRVKITKLVVLRGLLN